MEFLLEWFLSVIAEMVGGIKETKARTWAMTAFCSIIIYGVLAVFAAITFEVYQKGSVIGVVVLGLLDLIWATVWTILLVKGHERGWKKKAGCWIEGQL